MVKKWSKCNQPGGPLAYQWDRGTCLHHSTPILPWPASRSWLLPATRLPLRARSAPRPRTEYVPALRLRCKENTASSRLTSQRSVSVLVDACSVLPQ